MKKLWEGFIKSEELFRIAKTFRNTTARNAPKILTYAAVGGVISTSVLAVKATPEALRIMELERERRERMKTEPPTKKDIIKLAWIYYTPAIVMGGITIACIISAESINSKRNAALAGLYSITDATLREYQSKVVDAVGEKKEREIKDEVIKGKMDKNPVEDKEVIITGKGETLCYDTISGRYFKSDIEKIRKSENYLNNNILKDGFISLNEVYDEFGLEHIKMGDEVGWHVDDGLIMFTFSSHLSSEGVPCLAIDYLVTPRYDYLDR